MCGIWVTLGQVQNCNINLAFRSFMTMKNRGPDATRMEIKDNFWLGFHRLSINDLTVNGEQPFILSDANDTYYLVCNGEIYNSAMLIKQFNLDIPTSKSDCAVILPLFQKLKYDFEKLNCFLHGEYSMIIVKENRLTNKLDFYASTDPLSVRPLFMCINKDKDIISFSSSMQGLLHIDGVIERVQQCSYIIGSYNQNMIYYHKNRYYIDSSLLDPYIIYEDKDIYKAIVKTLEECVERRLSCDVPLGCLLSGGLDSSLVAAIASRKMKEKGKILRTFSIGMEGSKDVYYALKVAKYIGSEHTNITFTPKEGIDAIIDVIKATETFDITTIRASIPQYILCKWIRNNTDIRVLLNGDGADECQMGYLYFNFAPSDNAAQQESCKLIDEIHLYDGLRVDRCVSMNGLEARVPFLDKDFVKLYKSISPKLKRPLDDRIEKYLIRKSFHFMYPNNPILPNEILFRKKEAFSDGVSDKEKCWYQYLQEHFETEVKDEHLKVYEWEYLPPYTKESYYYRYIFECLFDDHCCYVIPHYWLPSWCDDINEPSATVLTCYNSIKK